MAVESHLRLSDAGLRNLLTGEDTWNAPTPDWLAGSGISEAEAEEMRLAAVRTSLIYLRTWAAKYGREVLFAHGGCLTNSGANVDCTLHLAFDQTTERSGFLVVETGYQLSYPSESLPSVDHGTYEMLDEAIEAANRVMEQRFSEGLRWRPTRGKLMDRELVDLHTLYSAGSHGHKTEYTPDMPPRGWS